jgi:hypothetical protein
MKPILLLPAVAFSTLAFAGPDKIQFPSNYL